MDKVPYIIVMGAAVESDGKPSGALKRRVSSAIRKTQTFTDSIVLVTGGVGKNKTFSEAEVMRTLLIESGIPSDRIRGEDQSNDTLSSVYRCSLILKKVNSCLEVYVCSDQYHIARCRWLFFLLGIHTQAVEVISGQEANGLYKWSYYYFREYAAIVLDTILVYLHKARIRSIG
jgi:vancomycin permeability regulator SanA